MEIKKALEVNGIDGLKTILGATIIVLSHQIAALNDLLTVFPANETITMLIVWAGYGLSGLEWLLKAAGSGLMGVGVIHKVFKLFR